MHRLMTFLGFAEEPVEEDEELADSPPVPGRAPVLSLHAQRQFEIVVLEPRSLEDVRRGADVIKARRPVVLNLSGVDKELARRIIDFMGGVIYALEGHLQRVGDDIILFTPSNVAIMAETGTPTHSALFSQ